MSDSFDPEDAHGCNSVRERDAGMVVCWVLFVGFLAALVIVPYLVGQGCEGG